MNSVYLSALDDFLADLSMCCGIRLESVDIRDEKSQLGGNAAGISLKDLKISW